jgi:hypothetical protein
MDVKATRSLDDIFIFRESKKRLTMESKGVSFSYIISKSQKKDKPKPDRMSLFQKFLPQARKRVKIMLENNLLVNQISLRINLFAN